MSGSSKLDLASSLREHRGQAVLPDSRLTHELVERYRADGSWNDVTLRSLLSEAARAHPSRLAAVDYRVGRSGPVAQLTFRELDDRASRIAAGLAGLGIAAGDGVAVMLPNCSQFAAAIFAIQELGAVYTGIPVSYGEREVLAILRRSRARAVVTLPGFRSAAPLELVRALRGQLVDLRHIVVLNPDELQRGEVAFDDIAQGQPAAASGAPVDPGAVCHIGFTSGTTGEPKGVMNTHQTLEAVMRQFIDHIGREAFGDPAVVLVQSPVGHHTGFLWGVLLGAHLAATAVYLDRWDPAAAAEVMRRTGITVMFGAPTFLQDLVRVAGAPLPALRTAVVAGAPVPRGLQSEARDALGCWVCPAWGMTEWGIGIAWHPALDSQAAGTDGVPIARCEVRVVGANGSPAGADTIGALQIRGPGLFLGYRDRPDANRKAFTKEGWFDTGDTASMSGDGSVTLHGRTKDIVIRGGENIPVTEVESVLYDHPEIVDVAIIGVPDERLGERAAAVVVARPGTAPQLDELNAYLRDRGVSTHFLPERLELVDALPKTASGKIRKVELRDRFATAATRT